MCTTASGAHCEQTVFRDERSLPGESERQLNGEKTRWERDANASVLPCRKSLALSPSEGLLSTRPLMERYPARIASPPVSVVSRD